VGMTITIMFTDIIESTALTERLGDSLMRSVLRTHDAIIRRQMHAHSRTEVKALGDGFMITFPSAKTGAECALAIQRELLDFNTSNPTVIVGVRIGLSVGEPIQEESDLFGHAVNLAARVNDLAGPGQIFVSEIVQSLLSVTGDGNLREVGTFELKGISEPQRIFEIVQR
jgi:class 3 adenylate cyclase